LIRASGLSAARRLVLLLKERMSTAHYFLVNDLGAFLLDLRARHYVNHPAVSKESDWIIYSKMKSGALIKHYSYSSASPKSSPFPIRVTYELVHNGRPLKKLAQTLKNLNASYRRSLPGWKTKRQPRKDVRHRRWLDIQHFLEKHAALIASFKYQSDDRITEGNPSYNLQIASTPKEQAICIEFIKALVEACSPGAIIRRYRDVDKPRLQRDGWIRRFAGVHRKRGWSAREIIHATQRELREGTWNQRSKLQYNLSMNTISKIAGVKLAPMIQN
jgi:hypothetical protein